MTAMILDHRLESARQPPLISMQAYVLFQILLHWVIALQSYNEVAQEAIIAEL